MSIREMQRDSRVEGEFADVDTIAGIDAVPSILGILAKITGMGFSAVARVTSRQWILCAVNDQIDFGLRPGDALPVEITLCGEMLATGVPLVIGAVSESGRYRSHPSPRLHGFESYISVPITRPDGRVFGALCALDPSPRDLGRAEVLEMFIRFAELIAFHIDAAERLRASEKRLRASETCLSDEREISELRDQFIAILGHDLRNPLSAIGSGVELLLRTPLDDRGMRIVSMMRVSISRMTDLIANVLDFARGRLGGGLAIEWSRDAKLKVALIHVTEELRISHADVPIEAEFDFEDPLRCDCNRISQAYSNLLSNAIVYGAGHGPIRARAYVDNGRFTLVVENRGPAILPETLKRLFKPFARADDQSTRQGLGLGLFIASEIANAHDGDLSVASNDDATRFTLTFPVKR
jgi:signal transduction histidine kinase